MDELLKICCLCQGEKLCSALQHVDMSMRPGLSMNSNNMFDILGKHRRENPFDDYDEDPAKTFFAAFGKGPSWNFRHWEQRSEWTENSYWSNSRFSEQDAKSRTESESFSLGTYADRKSLGLPATGPLKIEDVKAA